MLVFDFQCRTVISAFNLPVTCFGNSSLISFFFVFFLSFFFAFLFSSLIVIFVQGIKLLVWKTLFFLLWPIRKVTKLYWMFVTQSRITFETQSIQAIIMMMKNFNNNKKIVPMLILPPNAKQISSSTIKSAFTTQYKRFIERLVTSANSSISPLVHAYGANQHLLWIEQ